MAQSFGAGVVSPTAVRMMRCGTMAAGGAAAAAGAAGAAASCASTTAGARTIAPITRASVRRGDMRCVPPRIAPILRDRAVVALASELPRLQVAEELDHAGHVGRLVVVHGHVTAVRAQQEAAA